MRGGEVGGMPKNEGRESRGSYGKRRERRGGERGRIREGVFGEMR